MNYRLALIISFVVTLVPVTHAENVGEAFETKSKEKAAADLVKTYGTSAANTQHIYDVFLKHGTINFNQEATAKLIQQTGSSADSRGWMNAILNARANGLSDKAITILTKRYGQNVDNDTIAEVYANLSEAGLENGEAKAKIIDKAGTAADRKALDSTLLLKQFLVFISDQNNLSAFIEYKRRQPSNYRRFVSSKSLVERAEALEKIQAAYGK